MAVTRQKSFPYTVTIDGQPVRLTLKRLSPGEFEEYRAMLGALGQKRGSPASMGAQDGTATIADLRAEAAYLRANADWQQEVFDAYVTVHDGDVIEDSASVTNGRQFAAMFPGHPMLAEVLAELYLANVLTDTQKKTLQSLSGSVIGSSTAPSPAAAGETPVPTAAPVAPVDSAPAEAVTAPRSEPSSGTTDPSSFEVVPCAI
jgi:hypothetical protein